MISHRDGALAWYDSGATVVPVRTDGSKRPQFDEWKSFQTKRPTRTLTEKWYIQSPDWGVGLVCGQASGNLEMTEVEAARMDSDSLDRIVSKMIEHGVHDIWETLTETYGYAESTPSGGMHLLYRITDQPVPGNSKIAMSADSKTTYAETRGEGGFVVVAPSSGTVHPSKDAWTPLVGSPGMPLLDIAWSVRCAIHTALREALDERVLPVYERPAGGGTYDRSQGARPGDAFNEDPTITIGDILTRNGWKYLGTKRGQEEYVHPASSDMTTGSARTGHNGLPGLYAWSGMPQEGSYDKFAVLTHLEFGGDFSAAGRYLRGQGYGDRSPSLEEEWDELVEGFSRPAPMPVQPAVPSQESPDVASGDDPATAGPGTPVRLEEYNHSGASTLMKRVFGSKYRAVTEEKNWRVYSNGCWGVDRENSLSNDTGRVTMWIKKHTEALLTKATEGGDKQEISQARMLANFGSQCRSNRGTKDIMETFSREQGVSVSVERFDTNPNLLVLDNGTFDLSSMQLREHSASDMVTKRIGISYDPQAQAERWVRFLEEVVPDAEQRAFLQRAIGMTLLGLTREAAFFILYGPSGCGKSVFLEVMRAVFGEYAVVTPASTFQARANGQDKATTDLNSLRGARFASLSETNEGAKLDESLLKAATGGDAINSRGLYQGFTAGWKPQFTLWMATNYLPNLSAGDPALWRRVKPIEFPNSFTTGERDRELGLAERILATEAAGVLNWAVQGAALYLSEGFNQPKSVSAAVKSYQSDSDMVLTFLTEAADEGRIVLGEPSECKARSTELYRVYKAWCADNAITPMGDRKFGQRLSLYGVQAERRNGIRWRTGVKINEAFGFVAAQKASSERYWN